MLPRLAPTWRNDAARKSMRIYGDYWRTFRAAVAFERADAKVVFECNGNALRQFFRAGHYKAQAAEFFRRAAPRVGVQKCWRSQQHGDRVLVNERADYARVQRIRVVDHADPRRGRQAQCRGEAEGMKKGKDPHDAVVGMQKENLAELLDIRGDVIVREHHALWLTGGTAREDDRGQVVEARAALASGELLQPSRRKESSSQRRAKPLTQFRILRQVFQEHGLNRRLHVHTIKKRPRRNNRLEVALLRARR